MKRHYKISNIDCANCAVKMENEIARIPGVKSARVSFLTGRLTIESDQDDMTEILALADAIVRRIDREASVVL